MSYNPSDSDVNLSLSQSQANLSSQSPSRHDDASSDILGSPSDQSQHESYRPRQRREFDYTAGAGLPESTFDTTEEELNDDVILLKRALVNEKVSPDILMYETGIIESLIKARQQQQDVIDENQTTADAVFIASMYQMEIDRINFLISAYLRTRLLKIRQACTYILSNHDIMFQRLSDAEQGWVKTYVDLMHTHFCNSALDAMPPLYRKLNDDPRIREGPALDQYVFLRVLDDIGDYALPSTTDSDDITTETVSMLEGDAFVMRYDAVKDLIVQGKAELA